MIYNTERFNQTLNFGNFPFYATDIDSLTHISGRMWLINEAKTEGTEINRGQEIIIKDMVNDLGNSKPTFYVVTHHNTRPTEDITGKNLLVSTVYFKAPHTGRVIVYDYDKAQRPTFNKFMSILAFIVGAELKLKNGHSMSIDSDPFLNQFPNLRPEIIKVLSNEDMMKSFAEMESWDDEDFSPEQKAFIYACGAFDEMNFYDYHYLTWATHTDNIQQQ